MTAPDFNFVGLPSSLRMTYRVIDSAGRTLGMGIDLPSLKQKLIPAYEASLKASTDPVVVAAVREKTQAEIEAQKAAEAAAIKQAQLDELTMQQEIIERIREFNRLAGNERD
jgi:arginase family enzyme